MLPNSELRDRLGPHRQLRADGGEPPGRWEEQEGDHPADGITAYSRGWYTHPSGWGVVIWVGVGDDAVAYEVTDDDKAAVEASDDEHHFIAGEAFEERNDAEAVANDVMAAIEADPDDPDLPLDFVRDDRK